MKEIIKVENLTKRFGSRIILNSINLKIKKGEIFGIFGENGAGKTTFLLILSTILKKDSGSIFLHKYEIDKHPEKFREAISIVFQNPSFDEEFSAYENLKFFVDLLNINNKKIDFLLNYFSLLEKKHEKVKNFSIGMKRKLSLIRGLLKEPEILILDEPSSNLDLKSKKDLWSYIRKLNKKGMTLIISTHQISEIRLCDRVAIIHKGKVLAVDNPKNFKRISKKKNLEEVFFHFIKNE